ncbi:glycosyltransferase family 2 protein [Hymenobacter psychrotolerans]|uniref:Undecaprenyl-phosphate 4-deoxy-4-formamido-L-arabinose transferase n=1 Tax=Hymenobacter psychrotolerans DSM 18569 TaxID=1121959 RepID=A0A1M7BHC1_9BACT|nr:glycosyltransferase family 2 protein [Hymenobacter psychrotolerans]SHL54323.1 undecaprenyl-phosphate 4-deoxy-4-formamido-L-arabinose transferase [Hymenobacter psychrotolerans DSM 18569]
MTPDYSVVVPVYQGQATLAVLAQRLRQFFEAAGYSFELVFVHDHGPDDSWRVIQELRQQLGPEVVRAVRLARNFGQHNALLCGFRQARGRFIITLDEDLQHDPADIALLIRRQQEADFDVVYGCYEARQHSGARNLASRLMRQLLRYGIPDLHPDYSPFRLLKASVARHCLEMRNSYTFLDGYLTWITAQVASVPVSHGPRATGQSAYTPRKLLRHSLNIFITFSDAPVRLLSYASVVVFLLTTLYSGYILVRKLVYNDLLPGFASLIIAIGFGVGLLLLGMGILGEYIHRINLKTTRRPNFVEVEILD